MKAKDPASLIELLCGSDDKLMRLPIAEKLQGKPYGLRRAMVQRWLHESDPPPLVSQLRELVNLLVDELDSEQVDRSYGAALSLGRACQQLRREMLVAERTQANLDSTDDHEEWHRYLMRHADCKICFEQAVDKLLERLGIEEESPTGFAILLALEEIAFPHRYVLRILEGLLRFFPAGDFHQAVSRTYEVLNSYLT